MNNDYSIQKISKEYIFNNCIKLNIFFKNKICIIDSNKGEIILNYDPSCYQNYINKFLEDDRRFYFDNYNIPIRIFNNKEKNYQVSIILDFNKNYQVINEFNNQKIINYIKVIKIRKDVFLIQSKYLSKINIININDIKNKIKKI